MAAEPAGEARDGQPRVGLVLVSHSARLAEGAAELARAMAPDVRIVAAGGMAPPEQALGTDASRVAAAIEQALGELGVLILMDLGSALLSAEMALDMVGGDRRSLLRLSAAPLVEGAVAAAVSAQLGEDLDRVAATAATALLGKQAQLGEGTPAPPAAVPKGDGWETLEVRVDLPLGLHARPAAGLIRATAGLAVELLAENGSTARGPTDLRSLNGLAMLQVKSGQTLRVRARGPQAKAALQAVRALAARRFDEPRADPAVEAPSVSPQPLAEGGLRGLPASPGVVVGEVVHLARAEIKVPEGRSRTPVEELESLEAALAEAARELTTLRDVTARRAGAYEAAIIDAHLLFLEDPELVGRARQQVQEGRSAASAWSRAAADLRRAWEEMDDPRMRLRAADLDGVARRVLANLLGVAESAPSGTGILVADELTPTDTAGLDPGQVLAIATALGGPTSHSAILARSLGIPAVVGLGPAVLDLPLGTTVLLDGEKGVLLPNPSELQQRGVEVETAARRESLTRAAALAHRPSLTRDGVQIEVAANIGSARDAREAMAAGADGVGLLRTEFLFQDEQEMPDEGAQVAAYGEIAEVLEGRALTVRTLDVGADKPLPYIVREPEDNPALGVRGVRLGLSRPELLRTQLRAILRVSQRHRLRVMFPMVASLEELAAARSLLASLGRAAPIDGVPDLEVGIMVEVPSAALTAPSLAPFVDFMSVGTNDLSQYTLAADRTNPGVAALADALHPAVLRLIRETARAAAKAGRWVGVCGELAGEPTATALLIGLGVTELSMAPVRVPAVKAAVRSVDAEGAGRLAARALALPHAVAVRELLADQRNG